MQVIDESQSTPRPADINRQQAQTSLRNKQRRRRWKDLSVCSPFDTDSRLVTETQSTLLQRAR